MLKTKKYKINVSDTMFSQYKKPEALLKISMYTIQTKLSGAS